MGYGLCCSSHLCVDDRTSRGVLCIRPRRAGGVARARHSEPVVLMTVGAVGMNDALVT